MQPAICASCSVTPWLASSSSSTTCADSIACNVLTTENFSTAAKTLPLRRKPAVSTSSKRWPLRSNGTVIASRVVPGVSNATSRSSPSQKPLPFPPPPRRIHQLEALAIALERHRDRIPGGARGVECDQPLFPQPGIDQCRFAHVRAACHGQPDDAPVSAIDAVGVGQVARGRICPVVRRTQRLQRHLHQAADALAMRRRHRVDGAESQFIKLGPFPPLILLHS